MSEPREKHYLIGQLAKLAGVKSDTVRFYERKGLLPRATRSATDYRIYDDAAVERLSFVRKAQALGFSLDEIGRILIVAGALQRDLPLRGFNSRGHPGRYGH